MIKNRLITKLIKFFEENRIQYFRYRGCFDFLVKSGDKVYALKVLNNIDAFLEFHAEGLKSLAKGSNIEPLLIGVRTNKEILKNNILYHRFGIYAANFKTLKNILIKYRIPPTIHNKKGAYTLVDKEKLKNARNSRMFSQEALANKIKVSKKNVYEHEQNDIFMSQESYRSLKNVLGMEVSKQVNFNKNTGYYSKPELSSFENNVCKTFTGIGFSINIIRKSPFNIIAKKTETLMSYVQDNTRKIKTEMEYLNGVSDFFKKPVLLITKDGYDSENLPALTLSELKEKNEKKLFNLVKKC